jgi:hypothetical protein
MGGSGAIVDLGASWIHGIGKGADGDTKGKWKNQWNPVYQIAKDNEIVTHRTWKKDEMGVK